jgi:hypothetical protein
MSTGILIYCFDTDKILYHPTTNFCISQIKRYLNLPVTVITNKNTQKNIQGADSFVIIDNQINNRRSYKGETVDWYNLERACAYDYSPYDVTILLDSDYFVYSQQLKQLADAGYDFLLHNKVYDLTGRHSFDYRTRSLIPLVWATVVIFKKNDRVKSIFSLIKHIQNNYQHYCTLYRIDFRNFRNDYAFAIAMNQLNVNDFIPVKMAMLPIDTDVVKIDSDSVIFKYQNKKNSITKQDVHVLNKEIPFNV